ncbi:MAG: hypothetical protein K8S87_07865, partial [Planctomycetes bacterium]|nr:hypothetical protein [Planctomycetota bacterium]
PFEAENLTITVKNYSNMSAQGEIIIHPGTHVLKNVEIAPKTEIDISITLEELIKLFENSESKEFSFNDAILAKNPLYFVDLTQKYTINREFPILFELRNLTNTNDLRPANNFAFLTISEPLIPKVSVIGEDADNDIVRILFGLLQESGILKLVKLKEFPEVVFQLGKTALKIPENVHLVKFLRTFVEMNAPPAYFWKKSSLIDAESLQKLFFSLKKVSYHIPNTGETLLDSSNGILGKITRQNGKTKVHFSFSINPLNSDFLLRSEIGPTLFSKLLKGFYMDYMKLRFKPAFFTDENIEFTSSRYIEKLHLQSPGNDRVTEFKGLSKDEINIMLNPGIAGISQLQIPEKNHYIAINTIRVVIDIDESNKLNWLTAGKKRTKIEQKPDVDDETRLMILFIQIAFLLVLAEAVLYRMRLSE